MDNTQKVLDYISTQMLGVISYINTSGKPQAALVGITETPDLKLIFGTDKTSRKYQNLLKNPHVALVIGTDREVSITVQYEGVAKELTGKELDQARDLHLKKNPNSKKFAFKESQTFFMVKPTWVRFSAMAQNPPEMFEISFDK
ncbi:MAG: pyridoxamine 5'-phosphate oxidase family protein [Candidatus Andersenbacteria bacterium]|nr:pyridoxamine 5'-phosphate oxidase family protein [Candidatus Andersenbacteria bacterium]